MAKNKQSNLIARVKMLNVGVINKYTINLEIGGLSSISLLPIIPLKSLFISPDYFSVSLPLFPLKSLLITPPPIIFLYKLWTKYCRLLYVSFIELYEL